MSYYSYSTVFGKGDKPMTDFRVDKGRCIKCGECLAECPAEVIRWDEDGTPCIDEGCGRVCYQCQHCLAICPTAAVSVVGKKPEDSLSLSADSFPSKDQMSMLIRGRRSVRRYKDDNVDPVLLSELLRTLAHAPTGVNARDITFTVIDDKETMRSFKAKALRVLEEAARGSLPERFSFLVGAPAAYFEQDKDMIFRNAPHVLVASAPKNAPCPYEDVVLSIAYFDLLAQSAGLGTVWAGLLHLLMMVLPELGPMLGVSTDHVSYPMLFGYPAVKFPRTVQRDDAAVVKRVIL